MPAARRFPQTMRSSATDCSLVWLLPRRDEFSHKNSPTALRSIYTLGPFRTLAATKPETTNVRHEKISTRQFQIQP